MGTWGPAIFSDDAASDLRSDYKEILASGVSDEEALERVLTDYADDFVDADVGPGLRIALALTLHKVGRLPDEIRDRALAAIEAGSDERWDSPALIKARATALDAARVTLTLPQPARKRITKRWAEQTTLEPGMVLAYSTEQGTTLLRVARLDSFEGGSSALVRTIVWNRPELPSAWRLRWLKDQRINTVTYVWLNRRPKVVPSATLVYRAKKSDADFDAVGFSVVGRVPRRKRDADVPLQSSHTWARAAEAISSGEWFHCINANWYMGGAWPAERMSEVVADVADSAGSPSIANRHQREEE
jgi:hypothetical protein